MCDEGKLAEWAKQAVSRRQFGALTGAAALATYAAGGTAAHAQGTADLTERGVTFATPDGTMDAFMVQPASGKHLVVEIVKIVFVEQ